ncbi:hypothetical protein ACF3MZ_05300 [Paenibacillaceae bacterium WGS1546]|uniref:hypothetical protein n=1 Tax=Cohnella sp. WGS1546 TaxID=3366810 RepID=UPI00372D067C
MKQIIHTVVARLFHFYGLLIKINDHSRVRDIDFTQNVPQFLYGIGIHFLWKHGKTPRIFDLKSLYHMFIIEAFAGKTAGDQEHSFLIVRHRTDLLLNVPPTLLPHPAAQHDHIFREVLEPFRKVRSVSNNGDLP